MYFTELDTARAYMESGFSKNEGTFTWTDAENAVLVFQLSGIPGELELIMEHGNHGEQEIEVFVNDVLVDRYTASGETRKTIGIPKGTVEGTELSLRLHLPKASSPASEGTGQDMRLLGISMKSLVIRQKR